MRATVSPRPTRAFGGFRLGNDRDPPRMPEPDPWDSTTCLSCTIPVRRGERRCVAPRSRSGSVVVRRRPSRHDPASRTKHRATGLRPTWLILCGAKVCGQTAQGCPCGQDVRCAYRFRSRSVVGGAGSGGFVHDDSGDDVDQHRLGVFKRERGVGRDQTETESVDHRQKHERVMVSRTGA